MKLADSRFFYIAKASKNERNFGLEGMPKKKNDFQRESSGLSKSLKGRMGLEDNSGQPNENFHPTVKPVKLMEYLINLITPPGGTVLDPFMGSGTTGVAAKRLNFKFVGIERDSEYIEIAERRISSVAKRQGAKSKLAFNSMNWEVENELD
jgi:DNA modification methylase